MEATVAGAKKKTPFVIVLCIYVVLDPEGNVLGKRESFISPRGVAAKRPDATVYEISYGGFEGKTPSVWARTGWFNKTDTTKEGFKGVKAWQPRHVAKLTKAMAGISAAGQAKHDVSAKLAA
jgi:hypothetical protein